MRRFGLLFVAAGLALLLAAQPTQVRAEGKGSEGPQSDQPADTPGSGAGGGGRGIPSQTEAPPGPPPRSVRNHQRSDGIPPPRPSGATAARCTSQSATRASGRPPRTRARARWTPAATRAARDCKPIGAWNSGCLYITTGTSRSRAGWGSGDSIDAALKKCRSYGFSCKKPIGGCVN